VQFVQDAVFAQGSGGDAEPVGDPVGLHGAAVGGVVVVDDQVRVGGGWPAAGAVAR
jgi:hypothetical protein